MSKAHDFVWIVYSKDMSEYFTTWSSEKEAIAASKGIYNNIGVVKKYKLCEEENKDD